MVCEDEVLLQGKKFRHVMEPINVRTGKVEAFLARFKPSIRCDAVPIADVYGRHPAIQSALFLFFVGSALSTGAANIPMLLVGRGISGIGVAGLLTVSLYRCSSLQEVF